MVRSADRCVVPVAGGLLRCGAMASRRAGGCRPRGSAVPPVVRVVGEDEPVMRGSKRSCPEHRSLLRPVNPLAHAGTPGRARGRGAQGAMLESCPVRPGTRACVPPWLPGSPPMPNTPPAGPTALTAIFLAYSVLMGMSLSFILKVYTESSIFKTFAVTAGMFGVMAVVVVAVPVATFALAIAVATAVVAILGAA